MGSRKRTPAKRSAPVTQNVAGADAPHIIDENEKRVPLADYLATPVDDTFIVYTDNDGKQHRVKRANYREEK